jgi:hypothetical protein
MKMNDTDRARERRRQTRLEHLGTNNPICPCCGERDDRGFDKHHLCGRHFDKEFTILTCATDHRILTDMQKDHPKQINTPPCLDERLAHFLFGLADALELIISKLREFANDLIERVRSKGAAPSVVASA